MKLLTRKNDPVNRNGVTIVEVLTSIVVAVIGVAGVLVLIPFAVRQASVGLDLEEATAMAENAMARFEIEGFNRALDFNGTGVLPWVTPRQPLQPNVLLETSGTYVADPLVKTISQEVVASFANPTVPLDPSNPVKPIGYYMIDPLWLNSQLNTDEDEDVQRLRFYDMFAYAGRLPGQVSPLEMAFRNGDPNFGDFGAPPVQPRFVTLLNSANPFFMDPATNPPTAVPNAMTPAIAARMFVSDNDLQFAFEQDQDGNEIDDKGPPQPYIDRLGNVNLRRQSRGAISWSARSRSPGEKPRKSI